MRSQVSRGTILLVAKKADTTHYVDMLSALSL